MCSHGAVGVGKRVTNFVKIQCYDFLRLIKLEEWVKGLRMNEACVISLH